MSVHYINTIFILFIDISNVNVKVTVHDRGQSTCIERYNFVRHQNFYLTVAETIDVTCSCSMLVTFKNICSHIFTLTFPKQLTFFFLSAHFLLIFIFRFILKLFNNPNFPHYFPINYFFLLQNQESWLHLSRSFRKHYLACYWR